MTSTTKVWPTSMDKEKYSFRIYSEHLPPKKTEKKAEKNNKKKKTLHSTPQGKNPVGRTIH